MWKDGEIIQNPRLQVLQLQLPGLIYLEAVFLRMLGWVVAVVFFKVNTHTHTHRLYYS